VATNVKVNRTCEWELKIYYSRQYVKKSQRDVRIIGHCVVKTTLGSLFGEHQYRRSRLKRLCSKKFVPAKATWPVRETARIVFDVQCGLLRQLSISNGANLLIFGWEVI